MASTNPITTADSSVHVKIAVNGKDENRKFKLNLKDCYASVLPDKVRPGLPISNSDESNSLAVFDEAFSFIPVVEHN